MSNRIPQNFLDELLARTDIVALIEQYIPLKKSGSNYLGLCPFHNDKKPSMNVIPQKQFYYCFSCGASGNAIGFVMNYEHQEFRDAVEQLASQAGMEIPEEANSQESQGHKDLYELMQKIAQFYQHLLQNHSAGNQAQTYLKNRQLSADIIARYGIGFAAPGWDNLIKRAGKTPQARRQLLQTGMTIERDGGGEYDRFRNRVMFPIKDQRGRVVAFGGRVLSSDETPKYLNSPETAIFHKSHELYGLYEARKARKLDKLLVVEGYMDVVSLAQHGIDYGVATLGTAVTASHVQRLLRACKKIIFCFDGDQAGAKAAWKALEISLPVASDDALLQFCFLPQSEDPDSLVQKEGQQKFEQRLEGAPTLSEFFFEHLSERVNIETIEGRSQLTTLAMPYIQNIRAPMLKEQMLNQLSNITKSEKDVLNQWQETQQKPRQPEKKSEQNQQTPVRTLIALLLQQPSLINHLDQNIDTILPDSTIPGLDIAKKILAISVKNPYISTGSLLEHWRDKPEFKHLSKIAMTELLIPESGMADELQEAISRIHAQAIEFDIDALFKKAKTAGLSDIEKQKLQKLLQKLRIYKQNGAITAI